MNFTKSFTKNVLRTLVMAFCFVAMAFAMVACNEEAKITLIKVDTTASTLTVEQGGTIDDLNIVVKGYFDDGKEISIDVSDKALTFSELNTSQAGVFPLTVSYTIGEGESEVVLSDTVNVTVTKKVQSIAFATNDGLPAFVEEGQNVDVSGLKLVVTYTDNTTANVSYNANLMTVTQDRSVAGKITVTVAYNGVAQTISKDITIKTVTSIASVAIADTFYQYQPAVFTNSTLTLNFSVGEPETIPFNNRVSVSGLNTNEASEQNVTITYAGQTKQTTITVIGVKTGADIESIKYVSGLSSEIRHGTTINYSGLVISVLYDDAAAVADCTSLNLAYNAAYMEVALEANAAEVGLHELTISLKLNTTDSVETQFAYEVLEVVDQDQILDFEEPEFVTSYSNVKQNTFNTTDSQGVKGFNVTNNPYVVGSQNPWYFKPKAYDSELELLENYATNVEVYKDGSTTPLTKEELIEYFDDRDWYATQMYDFSEAANGHTFRIVVRPYGQTDLDPVSFTFNVVDGYNVYNARELSVLDNTNDAGKWTTLKQQWGIDLNTDVHSIVLQNNINITQDVVPAQFFWTAAELAGRDADVIEAMTGSLRDNDSNDLGYIYKRLVTDGSTFKFEGNYFNVSVAELPLIVMDNDGALACREEPIVIHTSLFGFYGDPTWQNVSHFELNNTEFYGNTQKSENTLDSGGIICFKKDDCEMTVNNVLSQRWYISMFQREGRAGISSAQAGDEFIDAVSLTLNDVNAYDAYNSLIYNWAGKLYINNSHLIGAGGPVMICDHTHHDTNPAETGTISDVVVNNSVLESWIAGTEGWFTAFAGATALVSQIKTLDKLFASFAVQTNGYANKTFLDDAIQKMNLVAIYKSSEVEGLSTADVRGRFNDVTMDGETPLYDNGLDLPLLTKIKTYMVEKAIIEGAGQNYAELTPEQRAAVLAQVEQAQPGTRAAAEAEVNSNFQQAIVVQTYNGIMIIPTNPLIIMIDGYNGIQEVSLDQSFIAQLAEASGYINVCIFNGMGVVVSLQDSTMSLADRAAAWNLS